LFKEAYRCLKPGGYIENMEPSAVIESDDSSVSEDSAMAQWGKIFIEGGRKSGRTWTGVKDGVQEKAVTEAGFEDIQVHTFKVPIGGWQEDPKQKELGEFYHSIMERDMEGMVAYSATVLGDYSHEEIQAYIDQMRRELRDKSKHTWHWEKVIVARKPL